MPTPEDDPDRSAGPGGTTRSAAVVDAVAYAAIALLRSRDVEAEVPGVLRMLGEATGASRIYVYQNFSSDGELADVQRFEWVSPGINPTIDPNDEGTPYLPDYERYIRILGTGGIIAEPTKDAPPSERAWLNRDDVLSSAFVPIFVRDAWWGYIGFDDCWSERDWSEKELSALRVAAETIGAALEREELDASLVEVERRYRTFIEQAPNIIVWADHPDEGDATSYVSPQIEDILGVTPEAWIEAPSLWLAMVHPDDRDHVARQYEEYLTGGPDLDDYRMVREDGRVVWIRDRAKLVREPDGRKVEWGVYMDVTHLRGVEERLVEAESLHRTLIEQLPAVVYTEDADGRSIYVSPRSTEVLGVTPAAWAEDPTLWQRMLIEEDREAALSKAARHRNTEARYVDEYRLNKPDGTIIWIRDEAAAVFDRGGTFSHWQGLMIDVSGEKRAQDLERALTVEKATTAKLRELDELKDRFLAGVSHDLRTPLSSILGFAVTLYEHSEELTPEERRDFADRIRNNALKQQMFIDDLLDLYRLDQGALVLAREPIDIGYLVAELVTDADYLEGHTVALETEPVLVSADRTKVARMVENLLTNAARHTPEGTQLWVTVVAQPDGALISVEDAGPGIPDEEKAHLFEEFATGLAPDGGKSQGLGVGLSLVARFAALHGGRAWVEDRRGGGSAFRVSLPKQGPDAQT